MTHSCSQVECKKAQPKEVMLPANLAKTRAAGRGAYGELVMVATPPAATYARYAPYPLPTATAQAAQAVAAATGAPHHHHPHQHPHQHLLGPILAAGGPGAGLAQGYQYPGGPPGAGASAAQAAAQAAAAAVYDVKRAIAAAAAVAAYRPHPPAATAPAPRGPNLTYSMSNLLGMQGLEMGTIYHSLPTIGL